MILWRLAATSPPARPGWDNIAHQRGEGCRDHPAVGGRVFSARGLAACNRRPSVVVQAGANTSEAPTATLRTRGSSLPYPLERHYTNQVPGCGIPWLDSHQGGSS